MDVLLLLSSSPCCPPTSISNHLDTDWPRKFPPLPKNAILSSSPVLVKRHHLEPVFAPFQELATSSLFNNMEINFGKENHDIPWGVGPVSYFTGALELGHFFRHDSEIYSCYAADPLGNRNKQRRAPCSHCSHEVLLAATKLMHFFTCTFNIY